LQVVRLAPALDFLGLPSLLVRPEAVFFNESEGLRHLHHSMQCAPGIGTVDDGTRAIQKWRSQIGKNLDFVTTAGLAEMPRIGE
jgi:hypothetical protein